MDSAERLDVEVVAIYGAHNRRGLVQLRIDDEVHQMTPAKAREIAGFLLESAGAAESDEALMAVLERIEAPPELIGSVLLALRTERGKIDQRAREEARAALVFDQTNPDTLN